MGHPPCMDWRGRNYFVVAENTVLRKRQNSARQRLFICSRIDIPFATLLRMRRLAFFVAFLFAGLSCANAQWEIEESHTTADLRSIDNVGNGIVWASGAGGTVLRTTDSGTRWQTCAVPTGAEKLDFRGIQAFDENTAIVMSSGKGDLSRLYKTTDGCQSWELLFTNPDKEGFWDALQFYQGKTFDQAPNRSDVKLVPVTNRSNAMLIGDPVNGAFAIFFTHDGGDTWHRWGDDPGTRRATADPSESLFAASNSSIVSPGINGQYCFVSGGKNGSRLLYEQGHSPFDMSSWSAFSNIKLPLPAGESAGAFSIARREGTDGHSGRFVIVGGDYSKSDVGASVTAYQPTLLLRVAVKPAQTPPHGYRSSVAYDPTQQLWITVGPNGTDISTDDGKNWQPLKPSHTDPPDADKNWNALSLPFVVGPRGRIGKLNAKALAP